MSLDDQFPKMETLMNKEWPSSSYGIPTASPFSNNPIIWDSSSPLVPVPDVNKASPSMSATLFSPEQTVFGPSKPVIGNPPLQVPQQWLGIDQSFTNHQSNKGISDYWLSTTKTHPMKHGGAGRRFQSQHQRGYSSPGNYSEGLSRPPKKPPSLNDTAAYILRGEYAQLNFPDLKDQVVANSLNGNTAALLEAKLQTISQKSSLDPSTTISKPAAEEVSCLSWNMEKSMGGFVVGC
ncbi:hypothetical protein V6N12_049569 [Hibiscus sabdariffa]|uniref:Uncharacterized protein n=1 Tax=Hibiscus sabdariffa TaxID=183260 RepID=A0ABR2GA63_9ROSI